MLFTIDNARKTMPNACLALSISNMLAVGMFVAPLFREMPAEHLLFLLGIAGCIGFPMGLYLKFRSVEGTGAAIFRIVYYVVSMEFLIGGGGAAFAAYIVGKSNLDLLAFLTNGVVALVLLLGGMYREAKVLDLFNQDRPNRWKVELEKHIDYATYQVTPSLPQGPLNERSQQKISPFWIVAIGAANIPLLFEVFGGGRNNTIFLAVPIFMVGVAILNLKTFGPAMLRLILLRQLEKEHGRRFINADLEQIQELRCTFFLARWLVKDYAPPKPPKPHELPKAVLKEKKPLRRKKKRK